MSLQVKDATGATQTINTLPPVGQAAAASSLPVVLAPDQSAIPVSNSFANLAATSVGGIGNSATLLAAARAGRGEITVVNETTTAMRVGGSGVTPTTGGALLPGIQGSSITLRFSGALYAAVASGTATASVVELY